MQVVNLNQSTSKLSNDNSRLVILFRPLITNLVFGMVWRFVFFPYAINFGDKDETALTNMVIPICAMYGTTTSEDC